MALQKIQHFKPIPNQLFQFDNQRYEIRFFIDIITNDIWAVRQDLASVLNITNIRQHFKNIPNDWSYVYKTDGLVNFTLIKEPSIYRLIMRSNKPNALSFQRWVCEDILPSIRKTGCYSMSTNALTPQQQLQKQHLDNEAKKLDMDKLKLCQQVIDKTDTPQNKRYFEQYLLNSLDNNPTSLNVKAIEHTDPNSYMNEGVTQLAVENNIVTAHIAQKYGSPCGRYVATQYRKKYPSDHIKKGKKIFSANNTYVSPNTYRHKYKNEIIGWIREYFNKLGDNKKDKSKKKKC